MRNLRKRGISLVVLIVTIIVLIILTGAVIATFMEGGIIDRAKEAVFKNDIKTYQEELAIKKGKEQIELATGEGGKSKLNGETLEEIRIILPEFKDEYYGILVVADGEIMLEQGYEKVVTLLQQEWITELGLKVKKWDNSYGDVLVISDTGMLSGFKESIKTYLDDGYSYTVPEEYTNLVIPDTVTEIEAAEPTGPIFNGCVNLKSVVMPDSVTYIGQKTFEGCTDLTYVRLSTNITVISSIAFSGTALTGIIIPNSVTSIGASAFSSTALTEIIIPNSVTSIGAVAFSGCRSLKSITIPNSVKNIDTLAFIEISSDAKFIVGSEDVKTLLLNCNSDITEEQITVDTSIN